MSINFRGLYQKCLRTLNLMLLCHTMATCSILWHHSCPMASYGYGILWNYMASSGIYWNPMALASFVVPWHPLASYSFGILWHLWHFLSSYSIYGIFWHPMTSMRFFDTLMASYCIMWLIEASYDILQQPMASFGILWQPLTTFGNLRPPVTSCLLLWIVYFLSPLCIYGVFVIWYCWYCFTLSQFPCV